MCFSVQFVPCPVGKHLWEVEGAVISIDCSFVRQETVFCTCLAFHFHFPLVSSLDLYFY